MEAFHKGHYRMQLFMKRNLLNPQEFFLDEQVLHETTG
jgi:hypothetical protein